MMSVEDNRLPVHEPGDSLRADIDNIAEVANKMQTRPMGAPVTREEVHALMVAVHTQAAQMWELAQDNSRRDARLEQMIADAIAIAPRGSVLTTAECEWVKLGAIAAGKRSKLVDAVIEKGLLALMLGGGGWIAITLWEAVKNAIKFKG
jgi:hypothetical protein